MTRAFLAVAAITVFAVPASTIYAAPTAEADSVSPEWATAWQADLLYVKETLPEAHANLFHTLTPGEFNSSVVALIERAPSLSHHEIIVELAAIVSAAEDGHTRLTLPMVEGSGFFRGHSSTPLPNDPAMYFHYYPIRLYIYSDGLFVQKIGGENGDFVGAKVVRIGALSSDEAIEAASRVVHHDNEMQLQNLIPSRLVVPEILHALGIVDELGDAEFVLEMEDGKQHTLLLSPVGDGKAVAWVDALDSAGEVPLYLRDPATNFWFEYLPDQRTVYWQYNEVYDLEDESIADFATRLTDFISENEIERLVIDLRFNQGGDNTLNRSLLHALIRCPRVQAPGSLFVIAGRGTFSAAMMFAIDLERHTNAIFVGEPTGSRLNHYGDSRKIQLPNSGITIRASSLYWQYSGPKDDRPWIPPHIPATLTSQDYRMGRDPALETILAGTGKDAGPDGDWVGRVLEYNILVRFARSGQAWQGSIDLPDLGASELPLTDITYEAPLLNFRFDTGDGVILFEGTIESGRIIGGATMRGQIYPWAVLREL